MVDVEFPRRAPQLADMDRPPVADDYRPARNGASAVRREAGSVARSEIDTRNHQGVAMNMGTSVNLRKLQEQLDRKPLDEIAMLVQALTYGEMIELAEAMWKVQPDGSAVTQENLPALLHRWSKSRSILAEDGLRDPSIA
jgi:hypothetical protein